MVKIPIPGKDNEYIEKRYEDPSDLCEKLKISKTTMYQIINKKIKYKHESVKNLKGIIIEVQKGEVDTTIERKKDIETDEEIKKRNDYLKAIIADLEKS